MAKEAKEEKEERELILIDDPASGVRRITLNRPEKRNALNNTLRGQIFRALEEADRDDDVRVTILRGAGKCFSAGYDLGANNALDQPYHTASGDGNWSRLLRHRLGKETDVAVRKDLEAALNR